MTHHLVYQTLRTTHHLIIHHMNILIKNPFVPLPHVCLYLVHHLHVLEDVVGQFVGQNLRDLLEVLVVEEIQELVEDLVPHHLALYLRVHHHLVHRLPALHLPVQHHLVERDINRRHALQHLAGDRAHRNKEEVVTQLIHLLVVQEVQFVLLVHRKEKEVLFVDLFVHLLSP